MTTVLAVGNSAANSADFTVAAGGSLIVALIKTGDGSIGQRSSPVSLDLKVGSNYFQQDVLTPNKAAVIVNGGAGIATFRVSRQAGFTDSVGVETI
jgi:hypothetical protein